MKKKQRRKKKRGREGSPTKKRDNRKVKGRFRGGGKNAGVTEKPAKEPKLSWKKKCVTKKNIQIA